MGLFTSPPSKDTATLSPFSPPLGLDPSLSGSKQTVLKVKSVTFGTDCTVTDQDGNEVVVCKGKNMGTSREIQRPGTGQVIFQLPPASKLPVVQWGVDADGVDVFKVEEAKNFLKSEIFVQFTNASTNEPIELTLALNTRAPGGGRQELTHEGRVVAYLRKEDSMFSSSYYLMTVAQGVDLALAATICLCYDTFVRGRKTDLNITTGGSGMTGGGGGGY